jgi:hypothetical protein
VGTGPKIKVSTKPTKKEQVRLDDRERHRQTFGKATASPVSDVAVLKFKKDRPVVENI